MRGMYPTEVRTAGTRIQCLPCAAAVLRSAVAVVMAVKQIDVSQPSCWCEEGWFQVDGSSVARQLETSCNRLEAGMRRGGCWKVLAADPPASGRWVAPAPVELPAASCGVTSSIGTVQSLPSASPP